MGIHDRPACQTFDEVARQSGIDGFGAEASPPHRKIGERRGGSNSVSEARRGAAGKARIWARRSR